MRIITDTKLDFNDVLICPKRSVARSRSDIDLIKQYKFKYSPQAYYGFPLIISNMDTTGTFAMTNALLKLETMVALHKHYESRYMINFDHHYNWYTTGIRSEDYKKLKKLTEEQGFVPNYICIDVPNAYLQSFVEYTAKIRKEYPRAIILAGNVCTPEMTQELIIQGKVDIVKVGIGSGAACKTRCVTGVGYPQLSAIIECADAAHGLGGHICADGGCRTSGDIVKCFAGGADFSMIGGMVAGCEECEGEWIYEGGEKYHYLAPQFLVHPIIETTQLGIDTQACARIYTSDKKLHNQYRTKPTKKHLKFYGMSSNEAMNKHYGGKEEYRASEGKCILVPYKGSVVNVIKEIQGGIRSACTYVGAKNLKDLPKCTTFVKVK